MTRNSHLILACLVLAGCICVASARRAAAATLNVGPGGYATIQLAVNHARPGDVIRIAPGTYNESINLGLMGTAVGSGIGNLSIVAANGPGTVTLTNTGTILYSQPGLFAGFPAQLTIDGLRFNFSSANAIAIPDLPALLVSNTSFAQLGTAQTRAIEIDSSQGASLITVHRSTFDNVNIGVAASATASAQVIITVSSSTFNTATPPVAPSPSAVFLQSLDSSVSNITVSGSTFNGGYDNAITIVSGDMATLLSTISGNRFNGQAQTIYMRLGEQSSTGATIVANTITGPGSAIALLGSGTATLTANIAGNQLTGAGGSDGAIAIAAPSGAGAEPSAVLVADNTITPSGAAGLTLNTLGSGTINGTIRGNRIENAAGPPSPNGGIRVATADTPHAVTLAVQGNTLGQARTIGIAAGAQSTTRLEGNPSLTAVQNLQAENTVASPPTVVGPVTVVAPSLIETPPSRTAPTAVYDSATVVGAPVSVPVLSNDTEADATPLRIAAWSAVSHLGGSVTLDDNLTPATTADDRLLYSPPAGLTGSDTIFYVVADATNATAVGEVTITIAQPVPARRWLPLMMK